MTDSLRADVEKAWRIQTSFDRYLQELKTRRMQWNNLHKENFIRDNMRNFTEGGYSTVKQLLDLIGK